MFNSTKDIVFVKHGEHLYSSIIESITNARTLVANAFKKSVLTPEEGGSKNYPYATIFRFLDGYNTSRNKHIFNEGWVRNVLRLALEGIQSHESVYLICTEQGKFRKLNNRLTSACKADAILLLHFLWVDKAILLPVKTSMPSRRGVVGKQLYLQTEFLPELLRIFTDSDNKFPLKDVVGQTAVKNTLWYAYRIIRASDWYRVREIKPEDIMEASDFANKHHGYPFTLRQWLLSLSSIYPEVPYNTANIPANKMGGNLWERSELGELASAKNHGFDDITNTKISEWLKYAQYFGLAKKRQGVKTWKNFLKFSSLVATWIVNEVAKVDTNLVPSISEFKRKHLDGFDGVRGFLDYVKGDTTPNSYKTALYKIEKFFDYLETFDEFVFRNQINKDVDYPFVARKNITSKVIFDSNVFSPLLSFAYAMTDWSWYLYEKSKNGHLHNTYHNNKKVIDTESVGFVPIFWVDGKPYPIKYLTPKLAPSAVRMLKGRRTSTNVPDIHYMNLLVVIFETGIRLMSARWLDVRTYRKLVNNRTFRSRDYGLTKLFVNTDKVGGPWISTVSNTVIEILDRQAEYRNSMDESCLKIESWYDGHEESPFGKILPLFSTGGVSRGCVTLETPTGDSSFRNAHKLFMHIFQAYYYGATGEEIVDLAYDPTDKENYNTSTSTGFRNILDAFDPRLIEITPHSARSQIVSQYITLLPPSEIMKITGHTTEAHCVYYAQLDRIVLEKAKSKQFEEIIKEMSEPTLIAAHEQNSSLRESFRKNRDAMLSDFAATSFTTNNHHRKSDPVNAVKLLQTKDAEEIAFNTTHICPFNNVCPEEVLKQLETDQNNKPCGGCFYSVKTIDHIPAILAKIRAFTDESNELQQYLKNAKANGADASSLSSTAERRKFLTNEIIAWTVTFQCLEQMASDLSQRDTWLVQKPELLSKKLTRIEIQNEEFHGLLVKSSEAKSYAEFFTPSLEHQIVKARTKLLAHTGNFKTLLDNVPSKYELIDQYRGMVQSICSTLEIKVSDLAAQLEKPLILPDTLDTPLALLSNIRSSKNG